MQPRIVIEMGEDKEAYVYFEEVIIFLYASRGTAEEVYMLVRPKLGFTLGYQRTARWGVRKNAKFEFSVYSHGCGNRLSHNYRLRDQRHDHTAITEAIDIS
jgi:hypothetical protein